MLKEEIYHLVCVRERNGDLEYQDRFLVCCEENELEYNLDRVWIEWRGNNYQEYLDGKSPLQFEGGRDSYWSDCSLIYYPEAEKTVPDADVETVKKYFITL